MARHSRKRQCLLHRSVDSGVESETTSCVFTSPAPNTRSPSLPTEIWTLIVESLISICSPTTRNTFSLADSVRYTPRWYLLPLLQVSKRWYGITLKRLYQTIAVGSHAPFHLPSKSEAQPPSLAMVPISSALSTVPALKETKRDT